METFEPPKYLASLIAAVNDGAKSAQLGALAFTAIGLFLLATAFSATDEDLLLNHALTISQLGGTAVPVVFAFGLAPAVFVAAHFYTLIRYDMLAGNVRRFVVDLSKLVPKAEDRDRCRQLLANIEFVNVLAMPEGSRASSWMFGWTVRALLAVFPVATLLLVQLQSLRLQNEIVTWTHHVCIAADLVLLIWFFGRLHGDNSWHFWRAPIRRKLALCWMPVVVLAIDLAWLEVPGPDANTVRIDILNYARYGDASSEEPLLDRWTRVLLALPVQPVDMVLCAHAHVGCRFLTVAHRIIMARILDMTTFVALRAGADADAKHLASFVAASLRGRTLRFADLTESELFDADLTDADLRHTVMTGAKLKGAHLYGAGLQGADLSLAQLQGANLGVAHLQGADLSLAQLQGAVLFGAGLWNIEVDEDTRLGLADLREANFDDVSAEDLLSKLLTETETPAAVRRRLRERLVAKVGARTLPHQVNTTDGKILVTNPDDLAWRGLDRTTQLSTDPAEIDPALAKLLAETVAPIAPQAAEVVARRAIDGDVAERQRPLAKLLGCQLQVLADAKRVTLRADTIDLLRKATGPCGEPSP